MSLFFGPNDKINFLEAKYSNNFPSGVEINIIVGNHDLWMQDYLINECGVKIYHKPIKIKVSNKTIFLGHGATNYTRLVQLNTYGGLGSRYHNH